MKGIWDLRPTELTLLSASDNGKAYHANYSTEFGIAPSPSSPYAYGQTYALKNALEAVGTVEDTQAVAAALCGLPVPSEVVMQYLPVDQNVRCERTSLHVKRCVPMAERELGLCSGPSL